jgi:hypothetical protein
MSNPGPNIVAVAPIRATSIVSLAVTPAAVATITTAEQDFTLTGVAVGDFVSVSTTAAQTAGVAIAGARVKAADTISITYVNPTAASKTPAADTYLVQIVRSYPVATDFMTASPSNYGAIAANNP